MLHRSCVWHCVTSRCGQVLEGDVGHETTAAGVALLAHAEAILVAAGKLREADTVVVNVFVHQCDAEATSDVLSHLRAFLIACASRKYLLSVPHMTAVLQMLLRQHANDSRNTRKDSELLSCVVPLLESSVDTAKNTSFMHDMPLADKAQLLEWLALRIQPDCRAVLFQQTPSHSALACLKHMAKFDFEYLERHRGRWLPAVLESVRYCALAPISVEVAVFARLWITLLTEESARRPQGPSQVLFLDDAHMEMLLILSRRFAGAV